MSRTKILGITLLGVGLAVLAWVLYDASTIVSALHLGAVVSEAAVAVLALVVAAAGIASGTVLVLARRSAAV